MRSMEEFNLVTCPLNRSTLIEASAGTGKTHAITGLYLRFLLEEQLSVGQILVVSFTKASTAELVERVSKTLRTALAALTALEEPKDPLYQNWWPKRVEHKLRLQLALQSLDEARIFTIHGFCQRVLNQYAFESGQAFENRLIEDPAPLIEEVSADFWAIRSRELSWVQLEVLIAKNLGPSGLAKVFGKYTGRLEIEVLAPPYPAGELSLAQAQALFEQMVDWWEKDRAKLVELISGPGLKKGSYSEKALAACPEEMDDFLGSPLSGSKPFDRFKLFTTNWLAQQTKNNFTPPTHPFFDLAQSLLEELEVQALRTDQWLAAFLADFLIEAKTRMAAKKQLQKSQFFDDQLIELDKALSGPNGERLKFQIGQEYKAALIDEFQDTDPLQYRIFKGLFGAGALFLIGDPKQSIYAFRGADIFAYQLAQKETKGRYTMGVNWRSDPGLLTALNHLWQKHRSPFWYGFVEYSPVRPRPEAQDQMEGAAVQVYLLEQDGSLPAHGNNKTKTKINTAWARTEIPRLLASQIKQLLQSSKLGGQSLAPQDIAVLVRKNSQGEEVKAALDQQGIPNLFLGRQLLFQTEEAYDLARLLYALLNPEDARALRSALASVFFGFDAQGLETLLKDPGQLARWQAYFDHWQNEWHSKGLLMMATQLADQIEMAKGLLAKQGGQRIWSNWQQLIQSLGNGEPAAQLQLLKDRLAGNGGEKEELWADQDQRSVTIVTVHKAKGLEYPVVFCPYLWEGKSPKKPTNPIYHKKGQLVFDLHPDADNSLYEEEEFAESLRLMYVALTRAKHQVHLYFGPIGDWETSPLAWALSPCSDDREGGPYEKQKSWLKDWDSKTIKARVEELGLESGGALEIKEGAPKNYSSPPPNMPAAISPWKYKPGPNRAWRISSYSGLAQTAHQPEELGKDRDPAPLLAAVPTNLEVSLALAQFPKGAKAGLFFHDLLEHWSWSGDPKPWVQTQLTQHQFDRERWQEPLTQWLAELPKVDLGGFGMGDWGPKDQWAELEFIYPVKSLTADRLANFFAKVPGYEAYGAQLKTLGFATLTGYLKGFVDLVFRFQGRYYLADYKSNHLGNQAVLYREEALNEVMGSSHYHLQSWVYAWALHQHLSRRLPDYSYKTHFGGVYYLFLRAMEPGSQAGVHWRRPEESDLLTFGSLLGGH